MPIPPRKHCHRRNIPGHAHYLTFSCFRRQPFLQKDRPRQWLLTALAAARAKHPFDLWAWVIMPEHVHLVLWPTLNPYDISLLLKLIKLPVTRHAVAYLRQHTPAALSRLEHRHPDSTISHRFWQRGGGYDRNLFSAKEVWEKIHYIHKNPVRRGLVARPEDWPWSSAQDYLHIRAPLIPLDLASLPEPPSH